MKKILFCLISIGICSSSEFVISPKERKRKSDEKLSYSKLKEKLAYHCDPGIKNCLQCIDLLCRYQKLAVECALDASIYTNIADFQSSLANVIGVLVNGVQDLAEGAQKTGFGKATKKQLKKYCQECEELEEVLQEISQGLSECVGLKKDIPGYITKCKNISDKFSNWQSSIQKKIRNLS